MLQLNQTKMIITFNKFYFFYFLSNKFTHFLPFNSFFFCGFFIFFSYHTFFLFTSFFFTAFVYLHYSLHYSLSEYPFMSVMIYYECNLFFNSILFKLRFFLKLPTLFLFFFARTMLILFSIKKIISITL